MAMVLEISDAFPDDPSESVDSDGDGIGDNSDIVLSQSVIRQFPCSIKNESCPVFQ